VFVLNYINKNIDKALKICFASKFSMSEINKKTRKLVIGGDGLFAEVAYELFTHDSSYEVVAFAVENAYLNKKQLFDLPVVSFENLEKFYSPDDHYYYAAIVYTELNRLRTRLYIDAKKRGYKLASYFSSKAFIWPNCELGEHCFIFENNVVNPFVKIGNNVILWSGNHIGHHGKIRDNVFVSSHVVISGMSDIGENCFLGVNSTLGDSVTIGEDVIIGAGTVVTKNLNPGKVYVGNPSRAIPRSSFETFNVKEQ
tara:strand:- start:44 stop:808 length:765 start_codon:yes stop_codon:yes gene_type:complete